MIFYRHTDVSYAELHILDIFWAHANTTAKITRSCASVNIDIQHVLSNGTRQYNDENHTLMRVSEYRHTDISYDASHI